jgi:glycosyltransferase involved in cell wall biosynthesis
MKFLFVANNYDYGGAATGARLWAKSLQDIGHEVTLISNEDLLATQRGSLARFYRLKQRLISRLTTYLMYKLSRVHRGNLSIQILPTNYASYINNFGADFVFINWIQNNTISIKDLKRINSKTILVMHDLWFTTGLGHFPEYLEGRNTGRFIEFFEKVDLRRKMTFTESVNGFLCMSEYSKSFITAGRHQKIVSLPYPGNSTSFFFNQNDRFMFREEFDIPGEKVVFCFGADAPSSDLRKGFDLIEQVFKKLDKEIGDSITLVIFGNCSLNQKDFQNLTVLNLGVVADRDRIRSIYAGSDVVLVPSRFETFGLVSAEAQLCGTRVVVSNCATSETLINKSSKVFENGNGKDFYEKILEIFYESQNLDLDLERRSLASEAASRWDSESLAKILLKEFI